MERFEARNAGKASEQLELRAESHLQLERDLVNIKREAVLLLRDQGRIGDDALRSVQEDLDLEEMHLEPDEEEQVEPPPAENSA